MGEQAVRNDTHAFAKRMMAQTEITVDASPPLKAITCPTCNGNGGWHALPEIVGGGAGGA